MRNIAFVLNLPWTLIGVATCLLSIPYQVRLSKNPLAFIFLIKSFWWYRWLPSKKGVRAMVNGNIVLLSKDADDKDLIHELIHVEQYERAPFIHGFLYLIESFKYGTGMENKYEKEAYERSGSRYGYYVS